MNKLETETQENPLPIEDDTDKFFGGNGVVHLIKNTKKKSAADAKYYYMKAKSRGRGYDDLMLTEEEYERVRNRAFVNKEDIPKRMTLRDLWKTLVG